MCCNTQPWPSSRQTCLEMASKVKFIVLSGGCHCDRRGSNQIKDVKRAQCGDTPSCLLTLLGCVSALTFFKQVHMHSCSLASFDGSCPVFLFFPPVCSRPVWAHLPPTRPVRRCVASYPDCIVHLQQQQLSKYLFFFYPPFMFYTLIRSSQVHSRSSTKPWAHFPILRVSALTRSGLLMGFMQPGPKP